MAHFCNLFRPAMARKFSYFVLLALTLITVGSAYSLKWLNTQYSMRQFMPADHPLYVSDKEIQKQFNLSEEQPILVTLKIPGAIAEDWLEPKHIEDIRRATEVLASIDGIQDVTSISNYETALNLENGIEVGPMTKLVPREQWNKRIHSSFLLSPGLISSDNKVVTLIGKIGVLRADKLNLIVQTIRARVGEIFQGQNIGVLASGVVPLQSDMSNLIGKELQRFLVLAFLICLVTLIAYFQSFSSVVICLILVVISNINALAWMVFSAYSFSILSTSLPVLASITGLAIGSHTLLNFSHNWKVALQQGKSPDKIQTILKAMRRMVLPNFLMALTTAVGFATMGWSHVPLIREFAWTISGGILVSWFLVSLALPALMILFPVPRARSFTSSSARWALWVLHFRSLILGTLAVVVAAILIHGIHLNWAVRLYDDLPNFGGTKEATVLIDEKLGGMIPLEIMVHAKEEGDPWHDPGREQILQNLLTKWRAIPAVGSAVGLPDFLQSGNDNKLPSERRSIAEILFMYSFSGGNNPVTQFLNADGSSTRISVRFKDVPANEMREIIANMQTDVKSLFPNAELTVGGMATMAHPLNEELSRQLLFGLWQSLFWISLLMIIVFRSLRWALVAAIPNLLGPFALLATMSFLGTPIKPAVAIIFSIALGVAYNNTVYLMARLRLLKNNIGRTWYEEGNPCLYSSLAIVGGFAVFLSSYFSLNRIFGAYMLLSIGIGLFGDLVILPILLKMQPSLLSPGKKSSPPRKLLIN